MPIESFVFKQEQYILVSEAVGNTDLCLLEILSLLTGSVFTFSTMFLFGGKLWDTKKCKYKHHLNRINAIILNRHSIPIDRIDFVYF